MNSCSVKRRLRRRVQVIEAKGKVEGIRRARWSWAEQRFVQALDYCI